AERGAVLLCGGLGGVMAAAARGAKQAGGVTVGILPGNDPREANRDIDVALATGMGEMRNALIVRAASAVIAIGGGWGTLSEIATQTLRFQVTDGSARYPVVFHGLPPDTFNDSVEVVVEGRLKRDGVIYATNVLAKCGSRYEAVPKA